MKNCLFALAGVAALAAGPASAQSSVTLFGVVDATLARGTGSVASKTLLTNSGLDSSRVGFRGVEDLGGGLAASFWLEAAVNNDNGTSGSTNSNNQATGSVPSGGGLIFGRRSTVSLQGGWGELRIGRDYTPQYRNLAFEPFGNNGVGAGQNAISLITGPTAFRASNSITYLYNTTASGWGVNSDGVYGSAMYYLGENASGTATAKDGTGYGLRIGYVGGPLLFGAAVGRTTYAAGNVRQSNAVASYDFGVATAYAQYSADKNGTLSGKGMLLGATAPVGVGLIRASYSRYRTDAATNPTAKKWALGYVHNLSKRTALYATYAHVSNEGASAVSLNGSVTAAGGSSSGIDLGVKHSF